MSLINEDYYSTAEFAARHGVHINTVRRWVYKGQAPRHETLNRAYWFEKAAADAWQKPRPGRKKKA